MRVPSLSLSEGHQHLVRRQLQLRREVSVQRAAVRRAYAHGETMGTLARLQEALRVLELELDDVTRLLRHGREVA